MSTYSRITDDEMRYYQFKAQQQFQLKKEDHEWNEFSQKYKCNCCSCQPANLIPQVPQKEVGVQTVPKALPKFDRPRVVKRGQENSLSESLSDIRSKLEQISLAVSNVKLIPPKDPKIIIESTSVNDGLQSNKSAMPYLPEQRQKFIQYSILNSLERLHSRALQKPTKSPSSQNKSFFLPPELQKQRLIARNAYLESLVNKPKVVERTKVKYLQNKTKTPLKKNNKTSSQNIPLGARRKKVEPILKPKEEKTLIESEISNDKDENIEKVVDGILDDLVGEEIVALNGIRHKKLGRQMSSFSGGKDHLTSKLKDTTKKEISLCQVSSDIRTKIKQIPFFNLTFKNRKSDESSLEYSSQCQPENFQDLNIHSIAKANVEKETESHVRFDLPPAVDSKVSSPLKTTPSSKQFRLLQIDPKLAQKVKRQRKLYFQYLEKVSRKRDNNFDPVALTNMVAESIVDDCISDVCKELSEVPSSLIMDIYNQEFTSTL